VTAVFRRHPVAAAALGYFALTIAYTWPLPIHLASGIVHDPYDPILNTWILWWSTKAVPLTQHWWNAPIFYPVAGTLAFSEHLLGLAPIAAPLIAISGKPLLGYNVAIFLTFPSSALAAYFLAFTLTRRHDAAFVAGVAYAFAPYRLGQLAHIQVVTAYWTPLCLGALHMFTTNRRPRWVVLAAFAFLMQALSSGYYMFFLAVLLALWMIWFAAGRWTLRMFTIAAVAFGAAALLMIPVLHGYQQILQGIYGFKRSLFEIRVFSADVAGLLLASEELLLWGWLHVFQRPESGLFPGVTIVLLAAYALYDAKPLAERERSRGHRVLTIVLAILLVMLVAATIVPIVYGTWRLTIGGVRLISIARADKPLTLAILTAAALLLLLPRVRGALSRRSVLAFYLLAAAAMWAFALGPDPTVMDRRFFYQAPYGQLMHLPGFDGLRVPARFWTMALACLAVVAGLAVNRVAPPRRRAIVVAAAIGLLLDGWPRTFIVVAAPSLRPSPAGVTSRLELPLSDDIDTQAIYRQMFDGVPLHNGYSGYIAPHYYALRTLIDDRDPRVLHVLAKDGPLGGVVDNAADADGSLRKFVAAYPGATVDHSDAEWTSYALPRSANVPAIPDRAGTPLKIDVLSTFPSPPHAARALDGDLATRWSGGPQQNAAEAIADLGNPTRVSQVVIDLGGYGTDFAVKLKIDVSADGKTWENAFLGGTALHAYYGAIRHPKEMPLVFQLDRDSVRFIRLQQAGFGTHDWSIPELHVTR